MKVIDLINLALKEKGYDGLYFPGECACKVDYLAPDCDCPSNCIAGYLCDPPDDNSDFGIGPESD